MSDFAAPRRDGRLTVALVSETFWQPDGAARLRERLAEAVDRGADLALLPELPLNCWRPSSTTAADEDAEPMDGQRVDTMARAAAEAGIGLVGGIIHREESTGRRTNRAIVLDRNGTVVASYDKLHLPEEDGFWETSHYEPGSIGPRRIDAFGIPFGVQLCSDINRPAGSHLLQAMGAMAVLAPRATEERTYQRWKVVFRALAITGSGYVVSVNRPEPEDGVLIGGPSIAVDPDGDMLVETTEPLAVVTLETAAVQRARQGYPGHLPHRARLYAEAWADVAAGDGHAPAGDGGRPKA